ncbi:MAG TPA: arsenate reductase ArsC [Stellaceae bacterium]|jgi:protein-tyrosine-phosphatase|nr:arsenate reductase ArsC [Stellaceae bacterium]
MSGRVYNLLFLCTGNSARSIMAETLLRRWGGDKFHAFSAGSHPKGTVHPYALDLLQSLRLPIDGLRSKSWSEFARHGAPEMDFIITVCDQAAGEVCPIWPGQPMTAHWGVPDPAAVEGPEEAQRDAFRAALRQLDNRTKLFTSLPIAALDRMALKHALDRIGRSTHIAGE